MRILFISWPFPPYGGMSQRSVYFANNLTLREHQVDVLASNPSRSFHGYDEAMVGLVADAVRVQRTYPGIFHHLRYAIRKAKAGATSDSGRMLSLLWGGLDKALSPLTSLEWFPIGLWHGAILCRKNHYDVLYCHGDPFIANVVASLLKRLFEVPLVIYIGDPRYFGTCSRYRRVLRRLEHSCLKAADRVVVNCPETLEGYRRHFPGIGKDKFSVITDGFDDTRFREIGSEPADRFRILYSGVFYNESREPLELLKALARLKADGANDDIELLIAGEEPGRYQQLIDELKLDDSVIFLGHQPHDRVIGLQKGAAVLLLIGWSGGYQLPGKLFEYFAARRPILSIRYDRDDVASSIVSRYQRGLVADNDADAIAGAVSRLRELWQQGELDSSFDLTETREFTWDKLSGDLERVCRLAVQN